MSADDRSTGSEQRFSFGYQLITWDFAEWSRLEPGFETVAGEGFRVFRTAARRQPRVGLRCARCFDPRAGPGATHRARQRDVPPPGARGERGGALRDTSVDVYADGEWTSPELWPSEFAKVQVLTRFLQSCGATLLACGGGLPERPGKPRDAAAYRDFADRLKEIGEYTAGMGIRTVYHPHLDTFVETRGQLDRLMELLDTSVVGLCIDPAHFQVKRDDPVAIFRTYGSVIDYVHLKDCDGDESTLSGFARYQAFCELGAGIIDLAGILDALRAADYDGVVTVELDYSDTPDESCRRNAMFIRDSFGLELSAPPCS